MLVAVQQDNMCVRNQIVTSYLLEQMLPVLVNLVGQQTLIWRVATREYLILMAKTGEVHDLIARFTREGFINENLTLSGFVVIKKFIYEFKMLSNLTKLLPFISFKMFSFYFLSERLWILSCFQ